MKHSFISQNLELLNIPAALALKEGQTVMRAGFDILGRHWFFKISFGDPRIMPELILVNNLLYEVFCKQIFTRSFCFLPIWATI